MRTSLSRLSYLASLLLVVACDPSTDDVGANPSAGTAGVAGTVSGGQAGTPSGVGGSGQAGSSAAGASQAGSNQGGTAQGGTAQGGTAQGGTAQGGSGGGKTFEQALSDKQRDDGSKVSESDRKAAVDGNNAFAYDLFDHLIDDTEHENKNLFFSPISVAMAFGMTSAGAVGTTQDEIHQAMHFGLPDASLHPALNWLSLDLARRPQQARDFAKMAGSATDPDVAFRIVNAVWGEKTDEWKPSFLDVLAQSYGTGVNLGNFKQNPDQERVVINQWVAEQTTDRIKDLLPPGALDQNTRLVLVNAINLTFAWDSPFSAKNTTTAPFTFTSSVGDTVKEVPTMAQTINALYAENEVAQMVSLPLFGQKLAVELYVPKAGQFAALETAVSKHIPALRAARESREVDLTLPRFTFTSPTVRLAHHLQSMGMKVPFTSQANFSAMTSSEPLFISDVYHKAMVGFDEVGVQAAAATAVALSGNGPPPEKATLHVDRSFLVGIRDEATGTLLFFGRIYDPSQP